MFEWSAGLSIDYIYKITYQGKLIIFIVSITNDEKLLAYYFIILENKDQHQPWKDKGIMFTDYRIEFVPTSCPGWVLPRVIVAFFLSSALNQSMAYPVFSSLFSCTNTSSEMHLMSQDSMEQ